MTGGETSEQAPVETIFFTAYARLPGNITAAKLYEVVAIGIEIDPRTDIIVASDCTLATQVARTFVSNLMVGYNLSDGIDGLTERFEKRYHGSARKALITALKIFHEKWIAYKNNTIDN